MFRNLCLRKFSQPPTFSFVTLYGVVTPYLRSWAPTKSTTTQDRVKQQSWTSRLVEPSGDCILNHYLIAVPEPSVTLTPVGPGK